MYIRFYAETADILLSKVALHYLSAVVALEVAPVRLLTTNHGVGPLFASYMNLLLTPMQGDFVNVVCCHPDRWTWLNKTSIPPSADGSQPAEDVRQWVSLRVEGRRNILIASSYVATNKRQVEEAKKYDAFALPYDGYAAQDAWWRKAGVIPTLLPAVHGDVLRRVITGVD